MTLPLAALLLSLLALAALLLPAERARLWRGFCALHAVMGTHFLLACGLVLALFAAAILRHHGPFALAMALIAFLVCVRAHDLGEPEAERTELDADYDACPERQARVAGRAAQRFITGTGDGIEREAIRSNAAFERERFACALGQPHPSAEL